MTEYRPLKEPKFEVYLDGKKIEVEKVEYFSDMFDKVYRLEITTQKEQIKILIEGKEYRIKCKEKNYHNDDREGYLGKFIEDIVLCDVECDTFEEYDNILHLLYSINEKNRFNEEPLLLSFIEEGELKEYDEFYVDSIIKAHKEGTKYVVHTIKFALLHEKKN